MSWMLYGTEKGMNSMDGSDVFDDKDRMTNLTVFDHHHI